MVWFTNYCLKSTGVIAKDTSGEGTGKAQGVSSVVMDKEWVQHSDKKSLSSLRVGGSLACRPLLFSSGAMDPKG